MLKEAEIINQTGIVYLREDRSSSTGSINYGGTLSILLPPVLLTAGTGEDARSTPDTQAASSSDTFPYRLLSKTTGAELHECFLLLLLVLLVRDVTSGKVLTNYQSPLQVTDVTQTELRTRHEDQRPVVDAQVAAVQAERLREISGLTVEQLAEIFGVSRATYHKWMSGSSLHERHRERLLEVLPLIEEAAQRLGSPNATSTWLLTPVSPGGKKPIEYLSMQQYTTFHGFLLRLQTGQERFHPLTPSKRVYRERPREEVEDARERLRPRMWRDESENTPEIGE